MTLSIQKVIHSNEINICQKIQVEIFHHELQLFEMQIPDRYDRCSAYVKILDERDPIGTYRIVLPNTDVGLPIEETGFKIDRYSKQKVGEMSRLVLHKEKRGKFPFRKIILSAQKVAKQHNLSVMLAAILPHNLPLFQRAGFSQIGEPLYDASVKSNDTKPPVIIPMQIQIQ